MLFLLSVAGIVFIGFANHGLNALAEDQTNFARMEKGGLKMRLSDNVRVYPAIFSYANDGISVRFPDLPGCLTCGQTDVEALFMAKDALRCYLMMLQDEGESIPEPTPMYQLGETDERERITLVCIGDEQPVRHGEWIVADTPFVRQRKCSLCGNCDNPKTALKGHYCWYCGAKMAGGAK